MKTSNLSFMRNLYFFLLGLRATRRDRTLLFHYLQQFNRK